MTVSELISALQTMPASAEVCIDAYSDEYRYNPELLERVDLLGNFVFLNDGYKYDEPLIKSMMIDAKKHQLKEQAEELYKKRLQEIKELEF